MATGVCEAIRSVPIVLLGGIGELAIYHCSMRPSPALTNFSWAGGPTQITAQLLAVARAADDSALDTLWVSDHLLQADPATPPPITTARIPIPSSPQPIPSSPQPIPPNIY